MESRPFVSLWGACIFIGLIGLFFLVVTYGALIVSKKSGHYVSGAPCVGGILIAVAFLTSPCKWLALLGLLDYGVWMLPYLLIKDLVFGKKSEPAASDNSKEKQTNSEREGL